MHVDLTKHLYTLIIQELDMCSNCKQSKDTIKHDCSTMLRTLGDYQDLFISKHASLAKDFLRSQILSRRLGKRVCGFISMRQPLMDYHGPH